MQILFIQASATSRTTFEKSVAIAVLPYEYAIAGSANEVKAAIAVRDFDLAILEVSPSNNTTLEIFSELQTRQIPVIVQVDLGEEDTLIDWMQQGAQDYIIKIPNYLKLLPIVIQKVFDRLSVARALQQRDDRLQTILANTVNGLLVVDFEGEILFTNLMTEQMLGKTKEQLLGQQLGIPSIGDGGFHEIELLQPNGKHLVAEMHSSLTIWENRPAHLISLVNITTRRQVEASLRESENRLSLALSAAKAGIWEFYPENNLLIWSDENYHLLGFEPNTIEPDYDLWLSAIYPEDRGRVERFIRQAIASGSVITLEYRVLLPNGKIRWLHIFGQPMLNATNRPSGMIGIHLDISDRKQAEEELYQLNQKLELRVAKRTQALRESEERWQLALKGANDGIWDWDVRANTIFLSSRWKQMRGYSEVEISNALEDWFKYIHPDDYDRVMVAVANHFAGNTEFFEVEYRVQHKNGSYMWVLDRGKALRDSNGNVIRMSGSESDITQRKQTEAALQASELELQTLFSAMSDLVLVKDREGKYLKVANTKASGLVISAEGIVGKTEYDILPRDKANELVGYIQQTLEMNAPINVEYNLDLEGNETWFSATISPLSQDLVLWVSREITDRKQIEETLKQQLEKEQFFVSILQRIRDSLDLVSILETTVDGVRQLIQSDRVLVYQIFDDCTGKVVTESVVEPWSGVLGVTFPPEAFPLSCYARYAEGNVYMISDRDRDPVLDCMVQFMADFEIRAKLVVPIVQEGGKLWGLMIAHQCSAPKDWQSWEVSLLEQLTSQLAIAIQQADLYQQLQEELAERRQTEIKLMESNEQLAISNAELARATRLKDEFLANMSHELRTPLNAILGMSEGLQENVFGELNPREKKAIATIESSGRHLLELINDILDLAKIESGKMELQIAPASVQNLCISSLSFVKQIAHKKGIQLRQQISPNLEAIAVDELRIRQALINLLINAVKFTPEGGKVRLETHLDMTASTIQFHVIDTGIGIAPEDIPKLFQSFVQIDSSLNRQFGGTGLGLALVKRIVELHQGTVMVESTLGTGSRFTITLPYQTSLRSQKLSPSNATESLSPQTEDFSTDEAGKTLPQRVLLAEDNQANIETFSNYLSIFGYQIDVAKNGLEAVELARQSKPDIILMDIQMPEMNGLDAILEIRKIPELSTVPILALTALAMVGDREKCLEAGANEYLSKPVKLKQLLTVVQKLLAKKSD
ncbi:hypothetical protein TUMEXPCC7403_24210 [Tumidithrix helvetica PCC 7403]|uniref:PAS domain S-box protein n=1 Tax=Tumidithrix helvetica TaxID=3457545 RepID=UPI003C95E07F